jgi:hypothetical protein
MAKRIPTRRSQPSWLPEPPEGDDQRAEATTKLVTDLMKVVRDYTEAVQSAARAEKVAESTASG